MSDITEQTVATMDTLVDDMTTLTLTENPGNTTIPTLITNQPNYFVGFPDSGRVRTCDWCRGVECTDPECVTELAKDRTCFDCEQVFGTERELEEHYQYCNFRTTYPEYSDFCCDCCGSYFENQEQLDHHNPEICWNQQQQQQVIYCNYCGLAFETREQLYQHNPDRCWSKNNVTHDCSCCGDHFTAVAEYLAHERECWNEYELSRNGQYTEQDQWDEYQDELEQERLADFREEMRKWSSPDGRQ
jgi:hypothetical protein